MKVRDLKKFLEVTDDDVEVLIENVDYEQGVEQVPVSYVDEKLGYIVLKGRY